MSGQYYNGEDDFSMAGDKWTLLFTMSFISVFSLSLYLSYSLCFLKSIIKAEWRTWMCGAKLCHRPAWPGGRMEKRLWWQKNLISWGDDHYHNRDDDFDILASRVQKTAKKLQKVKVLILNLDQIFGTKLLVFLYLANVYDAGVIEKI